MNHYAGVRFAMLTSLQIIHGLVKVRFTVHVPSQDWCNFGNVHQPLLTEKPAFLYFVILVCNAMGGVYLPIDYAVLTGVILSPMGLEKICFLFKYLEIRFTT